MLLLFLTFSVLVANPEKLLYTVANPARGLLIREKKRKKKMDVLATDPYCIKEISFSTASLVLSVSNLRMTLHIGKTGNSCDPNRSWNFDFCFWMKLLRTAI